MDYISQLQTENWQNKRNQIILRDQNKCHVCENKSYIDNNNFGVIEYDYPLTRDKELQELEIEVLSDEEKVSKRAAINHLYSVKNYLWDYENNTGPFDIDVYDPQKQLGSFFRKCIIGKIHDSKIAFYKIIKDRVYIQAICDIVAERKVLPEVILYKKQAKKSRFFQKKEEFEKYQILDLFDSPIKRIEILKSVSNVQWYFTKYLSVHHHYYKRGKMAWEYQDDALISVCWDCHENIHKTTKIPFHSEDDIFLKYLTECDRCLGTGYFPEYKHVQSGVCFKCNGAKYMDFV